MPFKFSGILSGIGGRMNNSRNQKRNSVPSKNKKKHTKRTNPADRVGIAKRSLWFILKTVVIIGIIIAVCYGVFTEAVYVSNIFIIVTEGMEMRADCILKSGSVQQLTEHFSEDWLIKDDALDSTKYDAFHVDSYIYNIKVEKLKVFPWSKTAKLEVSEKVSSINAKPYSEETDIDVPEWENERYGILMEKDDGRWVIKELVILEDIINPEPPNTPDYSQLETDIPHW